MMQARPGLWSYLVLFLAVSLLAGTGYRLIDLVVGTLGCRHTDAPGAFLAYCDTPSFGYYEHGAYYFGLEPEAVDRLKRAEVVFLGNSHAQFAFSTDEVESYFAKRTVPIYLLGLPYGEQGRFPLRLIEKYQLRPKLLVIFCRSVF